MYASNSHSYTHLILALGIVREPTVWVFITSQYHGTHGIGLGGLLTRSLRCVHGWSTQVGPAPCSNVTVRRTTVVSRNICVGGATEGFWVKGGVY